MYKNLGVFGWGLGLPVWIAPFLAILAIWSLFWKGLALWHSARRREPWWFIIMLVVNVAGILEIIYLFGVAKLKFDDLFKNPA